MRFHAVIEKAIVSDFLETEGKNMHQVAADEFCMLQSDLTFWAAWDQTPCRESNRILCNRKYPAVGNGNPVCVASKILNGIAKSVKSLLDVWAPVFFIKSVFPLLKGPGILQMAAGGRENKRAVMIQPGKRSHIFPFELIPEDPDRDKEPAGGKA